MELAKVVGTVVATQKELIERLDKVARHTGRRDEPLPSDSEEQAQELENEELLFALDASLATELKAVNTALERIEAGEYTVCERCAHDIFEERLMALP